MKIVLPPDQPLVMAYDPGKANGWAMTGLPDRQWFQAGEGPIEEVIEITEAVLWSLTEASRKRTIMLIEKFTVAGKPVGSSRTITVASESIGTLKHIGTRYGLTIILRLPNERTLITTGHLRGLGWHPRGKDHAIQAARHLVSYLLTNGFLRVAVGD